MKHELADSLEKTENVGAQFLSLLRDWSPKLREPERSQLGSMMWTCPFRGPIVKPNVSPIISVCRWSFREGNSARIAPFLAIFWPRQIAHNDLVAGSSPAGPTTRFHNFACLSWREGLLLPTFGVHRFLAKEVTSRPGKTDRIGAQGAADWD